jgi:SAM-dependent methyltransferase
LKADGETGEVQTLAVRLRKAIAPFLPRWLKRLLRGGYQTLSPWFKRLLRGGYRKCREIIHPPPPPTYEDKVAEEIREFAEKYASHSEDEPLVERAPASWDYVITATQNLIREKVGFSQWEYIVHQANQIEAPEMLSLGSGPCGIEIYLAERITSAYHYHCLDINGQILKMGKKQAEKKGLNITVQEMDLNRIKLEPNKYDIITAFASLHHLAELEKTYAAVNNALKETGIFVVFDVIMRNGLRLWPEAYKVIRDIWALLPDIFKTSYTREAVPRFMPDFPNDDYSRGTFEAIRSQDVLPLVSEFLDPIIYVPLHSFCRHLLDTQYGPNYDLNDPFHRSVVEFLWYLDCYYVRERILPPGAMFAVMRKKGSANSEVVSEVAGRMLADSRSRQKHWHQPPLASRISLVPPGKRRLWGRPNRFCTLRK